MKNSLIKIFLSLSILLLISCGDEKDEPSAKDESLQIKKDDIIGIWKEDDEPGDDGCVEAIKIDAANFHFGATCPDTSFFTKGWAYQLNGNVLTFSEAGTNWKYEITSKTASQFKAVVWAGTYNTGEEIFLKVE